MGKGFLCWLSRYSFVIFVVSRLIAEVLLVLFFVCSGWNIAVNEIEWPVSQLLLSVSACV